SFSDQFRDQSVADCLGFLTDLNAITRLCGAAQLAADQVQADRLAERVDAFRNERARLSESADWAARGASRILERIPQPSLNRGPPAKLREEVRAVVEKGVVLGLPEMEAYAKARRWVWIVAAVGIMPWLPIWVIWAFLWRGGIGLRL